MLLPLLPGDEKAPRFAQLFIAFSPPPMKTPELMFRDIDAAGPPFHC